MGLQTQSALHDRVLADRGCEAWQRLGTRSIACGRREGLREGDYEERKGVEGQTVGWELSVKTIECVNGCDYFENLDFFFDFLLW